MLKPKTDIDQQATSLSVRLTARQARRLHWLTTRLAMNRTEVVQALIDQEYEAQGGPTAP